VTLDCSVHIFVLSLGPDRPIGDLLGKISECAINSGEFGVRK
jgi:hypothetical protein